MLYFKQDKVQLGDNILTFKAQITTTTTTKKTSAVKFIELIFRNNIFIFNFRKMCVRWKLQR